MTTLNIGTTVETAQLDALIARMEKVDALIERYAGLVEAAAKRFAPVDTGALRDNIRTELHGMSAEIISDVPYAVYQEYGTARQPGTPFMRPAMEQHREPFLNDLRAILGG